MKQRGGIKMLKIYNSLSQRTEVFKPIKSKEIRMYVCGPTVYGDIHLGNARPVIFFDVVKRYLKYLGYNVFFVSNITDIDDKIIKKAKDSKLSEAVITQKYLKNFIEMSLALGSPLPDLMPKATEYLPQMINYISDLIESGFAYVRPAGVYFRVNRVADYGILSKQNMDELNQGVRIKLDDKKENPRDFSIWKATNDGLVYDSPWGRGRPGWHTECAVMNHEIFGEEIDIHGGGSDLIFPHHENEIAQTMVHDHHHLARVWMHVARLDMNKIKMSKSLGNMLLVKDIIEEFDPFAFRLLIIGQQYRQRINYSRDLLVQFSTEYDKIVRTLKKAFLIMTFKGLNATDADGNHIETFKKQMNDDFNIPNVMTLVHEIIKKINKEKATRNVAILYRTLDEILSILGIMPAIEVDNETLNLYRLWQKARIEKDFKKADKLRSELSEQGWI